MSCSSRAVSLPPEIPWQCHRLTCSFDAVDTMVETHDVMLACENHSE
jgi:hypothetical protein